MRYINKHGNEISQEKYDSMNPTTPEGQAVKDGYKPIPGSEEPETADSEVKSADELQEEEQEEEEKE